MILFINLIEKYNGKIKNKIDKFSHKYIEVS